MSDKKLYELWRDAGHEEPAPELDARILAAARAPVGETKRSRRPSWVARFAPLSLAAVAVLGVALSMRVAKEEPGLRQALPPPAEPLAAPRAPAVAAPAAESAAQASREVAAEAERRVDRVLRDDAVKAKRLQEGTGVASDPALAVDRSPRRQEAPRSSQPSSAPAAAALRADEGVAEKAEPADAAGWLAEIERLLAAGESEQARQALRRFRLVHPDHPLPDALRRLAAK